MSWSEKRDINLVTNCGLVFHLYALLFSTYVNHLICLQIIFSCNFNERCNIEIHQTLEIKDEKDPVYHVV